MAKLPSKYLDMRRASPEVMRAYEALGAACRDAGPLDDKTVELVRLGVALASGLEGGSHSHARRALLAGCTPEDLRHVVVLLTPTIGFPAMMRARSWVEDVLSAATQTATKAATKTETATRPGARAETSAAAEADGARRPRSSARRAPKRAGATR